MPSSTEAVFPPRAPAVAMYGTFAHRLRALAIDTVVLTIWIAAIVVIGDVARPVTGSGRTLVVALFGVLLLYEPVMVWRFGATVGHRSRNLRVVHGATGGNPGFTRAFIRFALKTLLGALSFVAMLLTLRHQALHDVLTGTTVQIRDATKVGANDYLIARPADPTIVLPSRYRRAAVILGYVVVAILVASIGGGMLVSEGCIDSEDACTRSEDVIGAVTAGIALVVVTLCVILGWRGRLWGARLRRAQPAPDPGTTQDA